jgi:hypothetical protein
VLLELHPRAGDTIRMRLEQVTEVSAPRRGGPPMRVVTTLQLYSRAIVESTVPMSSRILAVTDSMDVESNDAHARDVAEQARRSLQGQMVRLDLSRDGTVAVADAPGVIPRDVAEIISVMPASFPKAVVAVGDTWVRLMPIPSGVQFPVPEGAMVRARFRLDSLSRGGDLAYVTMTGAFEIGVPPRPARDEDAVGGKVTGTMVVNRRRGWLAESRFLVQMHAVMPAMSPQASPMRFTVRITQLMRTDPGPR